MPQSLRALVMLAAAGVILPAAAQAPPSTDIYLVALDLAATPPTVGAPRNLTDRDGYDNQPAFAADGGSLLYTSQRDGQTDIMRLDLTSLQSSNLTGTPESEYSPLPIPGRPAIAVVRVEADGTQRLWGFPAGDGTPWPVFPDLAPVGYHAWNPEGQVAMFVLGEPATLWLGVGHGDGPAPRQIAADIGRSLQPIPGTSDFSFLQRGDGTVQVWRLRADGSTEALGEALEGSQDLAWTPGGQALMARDAGLYMRAPDGLWQAIADLGGAGVHDITRLVVSPDGRWLAFVAAR